MMMMVMMMIMVVATMLFLLLLSLLLLREIMTAAAFSLVTAAVAQTVGLPAPAIDLLPDILLFTPLFCLLTCLLVTITVERLACPRSSHKHRHRDTKIPLLFDVQLSWRSHGTSREPYPC